ncbi:MAG TPA: helix-turn-helix domain-containing protein, partial [Quisquiliibacterium sp.]|nr:helix-turn-helix domain-containing protein [Quisquiliibacterium sp.]
MPSTPRTSDGRSAGYAANMEGVAAVDRAMSILAALEQAAAPVTLAELAAATDLYKSTLLRLLVSLERAATVVRRSDQRYVLGPFAFRLGRAYEATHPLRACLLPLMQSLVDAGAESPSFHVAHDAHTRLCLLRIDSNHSTLDRVRAGDLLPLARGAPGKVLRAFAGGAAGAPLVHTSFGERDPLCGAVACPVFGPGGELLGALSLSGPLDRFTPPRVRRMSGPLLDAAAAATRALGGAWPDLPAFAAPAAAKAPAAGPAAKASAAKASAAKASAAKAS